MVSKTAYAESTLTKSAYEAQVQEDETLVSAHSKLIDAVALLLEKIDLVEDRFFGSIPRATSSEEKMPEGGFSKIINTDKAMCRRVYNAQNIMDRILTASGM